MFIFPPSLFVEEALSFALIAASPSDLILIDPALAPDTSNDPPKETKSPDILILPFSFADKFPATTTLPLPPRVMTPSFCDAVVAIKSPGIFTALARIFLAEPTLRWMLFAFVVPAC